MEINTQTSGQVKIYQEAYAKKLLKRFNFENCAPVSTPVEKGSSLGKVYQMQNSEEQKMPVNFQTQVMVCYTISDTEFFSQFLKKVLQIFFFL
jgi:hypothetical protein